MSATMELAVDVKAIAVVLEKRREAAVRALDHAVEGIQHLHAFDRMLVATGIHDELQLDHSDCGCRPSAPDAAGKAPDVGGSSIPVALPEPPPPVASRTPKKSAVPKGQSGREKDPPPDQGIAGPSVHGRAQGRSRGSR